LHKVLSFKISLWIKIYASSFRFITCPSFAKVAERFIAAVDESSKPPLSMGFFINYNPEDILRQADESTLRYQKGTT